jgi:hypothetical protein
VDWNHIGWSIYMQTLALKAQGATMGKKNMWQNCVKAFEINLAMHISSNLTV